MMDIYEEESETLDELRGDSQRPKLALMLSRKNVDWFEVDQMMNTE